MLLSCVFPRFLIQVPAFVSLGDVEIGCCWPCYLSQQHKGRKNKSVLFFQCSDFSKSVSNSNVFFFLWTCSLNENIPSRGIWTLHHHLVALFREVIQLCWKKHITGVGFWESPTMIHFYSLSLLCLLRIFGLRHDSPASSYSPCCHAFSLYRLFLRHLKKK